jgi:hypothetical protein
MKTRLHSPAPWRKTYRRAVIKSCNFWEIADANVRQVCEVDEDTENSDADADLIAAAPELLAALHASHEWANEAGAPFALLDQIQAAIAKAEGRG